MGVVCFCIVRVKPDRLLEASTAGFGACVALILVLEANALFGKTGPMTSVAGVIHCSLALTGVVWALLALL